MTGNIYEVQIHTRFASKQKALITLARAEDMRTGWFFDWPGIWQITSFDCQNFIKLVYNEQVWGIARYGLYPFPGKPRFLHIHELESNPASRDMQANRLVEPIGKWLIWYAVKIGLQYCSETLKEEPLITLESLEAAIGYYRDIIEMQYLGPTSIAPGEDGYAFRFSKSQAEGFCKRQEAQWGVPTLVR